jgi:hypothetical protein
MTAEARERARVILERADKIDELVSSFLDDLKLHVDLLRTEIDHQQHQQEGRPNDCGG